MYKYEMLVKQEDGFISYRNMQREDVLNYIWNIELLALEVKAEEKREKIAYKDIAIGVSADAFNNDVVIVTYEGE